MVINAIIERTEDGFCSIYTKEETGRFGLFGYGPSPEEAKKDFFSLIEDFKKEEDASILQDLDVVFHYDVSCFLQEYKKKLSLSGLEVITGINQRQLQHYLSGHRKPSKVTVERICAGVLDFAKALESINII